MVEHPTTAIVIKSIATESHDSEMCTLVDKMNEDTSREPGRNLGETTTPLIEQCYAAHQGNHHFLL